MLSTTGPVVLGFDGSDTADAALTWAVAIASALGAPLHVVHAAERLSVAHEEAIGLWSPARVHESTLQVAELGARLARELSPDLEVLPVASLLTPVAALDEAAADSRLVVVGTHGRGRVRGAVLGSTAYALSGHARCPVVVVPRETSVSGTGAPAVDLRATARVPGPGRPVVVGAEGSEPASRALMAAAGLAAVTGAPLHVVTGYHPPMPDRWGMPPIGYETIEEAGRAWSAAAHDAADEAAAAVRERHPRLEVRTSAPEGRPEEVLLTAEPAAGLVAVGARGLGPLASLVLGSTSRAVLHGAHLPVLVAR